MPQATCVLHQYVASPRAVPTCYPGACLPSYQGVWQSLDFQALLTGLLHSQEQCLLVSLMLVRLVFASAHAPQGALARLAWQSSSGGFLLLSQLVQIHIHPAHAGQLPLTSFVPVSQGRSLLLGLGPYMPTLQDDLHAAPLHHRVGAQVHAGHDKFCSTLCSDDFLQVLCVN